MSVRVRGNHETFSLWLCSTPKCQNITLCRILFSAIRTLRVDSYVSTLGGSTTATQTGHLRLNSKVPEQYQPNTKVPTNTNPTQKSQPNTNSTQKSPTNTKPFQYFGPTRWAADLSLRDLDSWTRARCWAREGARPARQTVRTSSTCQANTTNDKQFFGPKLPWANDTLANTSSCQHLFVPTLLWANTTSCQHYFGPTLLRANTTSSMERGVTAVKGITGHVSTCGVDVRTDMGVDMCVVM